MVQAFVLSFSKKGTGGASTFVGLANYKRILKDKTFQQCLFNTVFYFLIQVPIMLILALCLAQILNNPKIKGKSIFPYIDIPSMCDITCIIFYDFQILVCAGWSC